MKKTYLLLGALLTSGLFLTDASALGEQGTWGLPAYYGELDLSHERLMEHSGFDYSEAIDEAGLLYHIVDSGKKMRLYVSDRRGESTRQVKVIDNLFGESVRGSDVEDISIASCFGLSENDSCLFIGDIGGGKTKERQITRMVIIKEKDVKRKKAKTTKVILMQYPDGLALDAEAMAVHPVSGDIFIISKEIDHETQQSEAASIFKLSREQWEDDTPGIRQLEFLGELDLNHHYTQNVEVEYKGLTITGMDIDNEGKNFILSTYRHLFEFKVDLSKVEPGEVEEKLTTDTSTMIKLDRPYRLFQTESICYVRNANKVLYASEVVLPEGVDEIDSRIVMLEKN